MLKGGFFSPRAGGKSVAEREGEPAVQPFSFVSKYGRRLLRRAEGMEKAVLCLAPAAAQKLSEKYQAEKVFALGARFDIYREQKAVIASRFGIGAPAAAAQMEHLRALGLRRFFSLGSAGSLEPEKLKAFQGVFIEAAWSEEGCSPHYSGAARPAPRLAKSPFAEEGKELAARLNFQPAASATTGAPYRETKQRIEAWRSLGAGCAEMEAAGLISAAAYYRLPMFCFAVISDLIEKGKWRPYFSDKRLSEKALRALEQILLF